VVLVDWAADFLFTLFVFEDDFVVFEDLTHVPFARNVPRNIFSGFTQMNSVFSTTDQAIESWSYRLRS
jgi:hypothetical protein